MALIGREHPDVLLELPYRRADEEENLPDVFHFVCPSPGPSWEAWMLPGGWAGIPELSHVRRRHFHRPSDRRPVWLSVLRWQADPVRSVQRLLVCGLV